MKFLVEKSSQWSDKKPIDEATDGGMRGYRKIWYIDIDSLDGLMEFVRKYEDTIIRKDYSSDDYVLEIYDDYRE